MKYLHLINDEKFTDFIISLFEDCNPGKNIFLIGTSDTAVAHPRYTKTRNNNVIFCKSGSREYFRFINNTDFEVLFIHFLDYNKRRAILKLKKRCKIIWHAWGADIYSTEFYREPLYQPMTNELILSLENKFLNTLRRRFRNIYYILSFRLPPSLVYKRAVSKVNYCGTVIPDEINILKKLDFFSASQVFFSNISLEYDFKGNDIYNDGVTGNGIIIGNSIDPASNHLDCFNKLKSIGVTERKIIVPLTYGNNVKYRDEIVLKGRKLFGSFFHPLLTFMERKEYINTLKQGSVAIMNHNRQQAVGNIIVLLWLGCKIFLSEKNPTWKYLKRKGFFIYSFQNELNAMSVNIPLTSDQVRKNRELIYIEHGHENVLKKAKDLINIVAGRCL